MRRHHQTDDDLLFDENGVLRDGHRVRVPMWAMDSMSPVQRAVARHSFAMQLHDGHGGAVGHRPGFVYSTDASLNDAKERAYAAYDAEQADAYKHLQGGRQVRRAVEREDAMPMMDERERAYRDYDEAAANAWRGSATSGKC